MPIDTEKLAKIEANKKQWRENIKQGKITPQRDKLDTDLASGIFQQQWLVKQNGKSLNYKEKIDLWKQISQAKPEIFTFIQAGYHQVHVISQEQQNIFKQYLQEQGYDVTTPDEKVKNIIQRNKLDTDTVKNAFQNRWILKKNSKPLDYKEKSDLWEQTIQIKPELFIFVQAGPKQVYVISKERQNAFKQYLQEQGYGVTAADEKYQSIERKKLDTDLISTVFQQQWLLQQNGKSINQKEKGDLWKQISQAKPELFTYVQSGKHQAYVVSQERQNVFKQYLQQQGYDITTPNEKYQSIERKKLDTDLISKVFIAHWSLKKNGKFLSPNKKSSLWKQIQTKLKLFTYVQAGTQQAYVISQEKQSAFKQYLQEQGYDVTTPDEKAQCIERDKLDTDLANSVFQKQWILKQNGKSLDKKEKSNLWEQITQTELKLFTYVQAGPNQAYVISKEKQNAFKQYLQEQGYDVTTPYDKLHAAQEQAAQAQTPEERKKYLAKAKKIFEFLNPKTAKDKTCEICLNKISQSRE